MSLGVNLASFSACSTECPHRLTIGEINCSSFALVMVWVKCFGPEASAVRNGRLISVVSAVGKIFFFLFSPLVLFFTFFFFFMVTTIFFITNTKKKIDENETNKGGGKKKKKKIFVHGGRR